MFAVLLSDCSTRGDPVRTSDRVGSKQIARKINFVSLFSKCVSFKKIYRNCCILHISNP